MPGSKVGTIRDLSVPTADNLQLTATNLRAHVPALNSCLAHTTEAVDDSHKPAVKQLQTLTAEAAQHTTVCAAEVEAAAKLLREIEAEI